jgi:hypothetical protein
MSGVGWPGLERLLNPAPAPAARGRRVRLMATPAPTEPPAMRLLAPPAESKPVQPAPRVAPLPVPPLQLTRAQAKQLLDRRREGAPMHSATLRAALRASGDLRREWDSAPGEAPTRKRPGEHPRSKGQP